jgi:hypothetical protein
LRPTVPTHMYVVGAGWQTVFLLVDRLATRAVQARFMIRSHVLRSPSVLSALSIQISCST